MGVEASLLAEEICWLWEIEDLLYCRSWSSCRAQTLMFPISSFHWVQSYPVKAMPCSNPCWNVKHSFSEGLAGICGFSPSWACWQQSAWLLLNYDYDYDLILILVSFKNIVRRSNPVIPKLNNPRLNTMSHSGFLLNIAKQVLSYFHQFHYHRS